MDLFKKAEKHFQPSNCNHYLAATASLSDKNELIETFWKLQLRNFRSKKFF